MTSIQSAFIAEMLKADIETKDKIMANGLLHRFHVSGDHKRSQNGWYVLFPDFPTIGVFGCWKRHIKVKWQPLKDDRLTIADLRTLTERQNIIKEQLARNFQNELDVLRESENIWLNATRATNRHGYLISKSIKSHGLKYHKGALLVPLTDPDGNFHGMQRIWRNGDKRFSSGSIIPGHYYMIGELHEASLLICEGYSTGATLHEITRHAVLVAFCNSNLRSVAEVAKEAWPSFKIIICADDDHNRPDNPGLTSAVEAAGTINAEIAIPTFSSSRGPDDTDFNDLYRIDGPQAVLNSISKGGLCHV